MAANTLITAHNRFAFKLFAENPADVLLLEVGLGGRMDTTNVVDAPLLTIIISAILRVERVQHR